MAEHIYREEAIKAIYESDHFIVRECFGWRAKEIEEVLRAVPATPVPQWISVKDRLPEPDENPVLAGNAELCFVNTAWYHVATKRWELPSGFFCEVTHWMPLPEPPKGENDG